MDCRAHRRAGACKLSGPNKTKPGAARRRVSEIVGTDQGSNGKNDSGEFPLAPCPRHRSCSANICPMDPEVHRRTHLRGEPVCGMLLELGKQGGEATLGGVLRAEQLQTLTTLAPTLLARWAPLRRAYTKAAKKGSRLRNLLGRHADPSAVEGESDV